MKKYFAYSIFVVLLFIINMLCAQSPVGLPLRIQIQVTKPYPNKLSDLQSNPNQVVVMITNTGRTTYDVQLLGAVSGDNNISVRTSNSYRSGRPLTVPAGSVTRLTAQDVNDLFNADHLVFSGISKQEAVRLNGLPEGAYQVCIQAIEYNKRVPLSAEEPLGCSNIFMVSSLEPPVIIKPFADDSLRIFQPQNIVFSWSLPPGAPPSTQYSVRLVEVPDAHRNPFDVMRSSRQPFYEKVVIGAPMMLYGPSDPPLIPGRRYAMMVTAIDPFSNVVFRNGGRSEVIAFTYGQQKKSPVVASRSDLKRIPKGINIPRSVISGTINWYFKALEENNSVLTSIKPVLYVNSPELVNALNDPSSGVEYATIIQSAAKPGASAINDKKKTPEPPTGPKHSVVNSPRSVIENGSGSSKNSGVVAIEGAGLVTAVTATGNLSDLAFKDYAGLGELSNAAHPLKRVAIKIYAVATNGKEHFIASTTTNDAGYFEASFINSVFYDPSLGDQIKVYVNHPDFLLQRNLLRLSKPDSTGRYDMGTLSAVARTFRLKPTILNEESDQVKDATLEVYRPITYYTTNPNQQEEGNIRGSEPVLVNGQQCVKVASIRSGASFGRLFYSDDWADRYVVKVVHTKLEPLTSSLQVTAAGAIREEIVTIEKEYRATTKMPTLKGQVSKRLQPIIDVSGAIVTLYFNDDAEFGKSNTLIESIGREYVSGTVNVVSNKGSNIKNSQGVVVNKSLSASNMKPNGAGGNANGTAPQTLVGNANILAPLAPSLGQSKLQTAVGATGVSIAAAKILANMRSTTTDSAGHFLFTNLPISASSTRMTIRIPGSEKIYEYTADINVRGQEIDMGRIMLDMVVITVTGVVKNEEGESISLPVLRWVSGGSPFEGDDYGRFVATNTAGRDTLVITKLGFETKRIPVDLKEPSTSSGKKNGKEKNWVELNTLAWATAVQDAPSFNTVKESKPSSTGSSTSTASTPAFSAAGLGMFTVQVTENTLANAVVITQNESKSKQSNAKGKGKQFSKSLESVQSDKFRALAPLYSNLITGDSKPGSVVDLGVITLRKKIGRLSVTVFNDNDKTPMEGAAIAIMDTELIGETNAAGNWYSEVPGGEIIVTIGGKSGSTFVATQKQVAMNDVEVTELAVYLKTGVRVTGSVMADGKAIDKAEVRVEGLDYLSAQTNSSGAYTLIVPQGDYTVKANKEGYVGASKQQVFAGTSAIVNLTLTKPAFDLATLLGFPVEIDDMQGTGNSRILSGAFINVPGNSNFQPKAGIRIPFSQLKVNIVNGKAVPQGGEVKLSITTLDATAFNYLPIKIKNGNDALTIKQRADNPDYGQLMGVAEIDYARWVPIPLGVTFPVTTKHTLSSASAIPVLQSGEGFANQESIPISLGSSNALELYGFDLKLKGSCSVQADGLHLQGDLSFNGVPLLNNATMAVDELTLAPDGTVKRVAINIGSGVGLNLAGWAANLQSLSINENGLKLSGNLHVKVPSSSESVIGFDNLSVSKSGLYGGNFSLPADGLDIFSIVKMKAGPRPLTFGRIGNTSVHYIGGSGKFDLPKFIDRTLTVEFFQIQTDGNFAATVPANFNVDFLSMASVSISSIGFHTMGGAGIDVVGDFNLNAIPFFKATVGGIHYRPGGSVSVDELGVSCDLIGIAKLTARAKFSDQPNRKGFEGNGKIQISATPLNLELGFKYYKLPNGVEVGGLLRVGMVIPIGAITLTEVEGEFSLNTQDKKWMGRIGASLSVGALNAAVAIKPLSITVQNGPVFILDGGLAVLDQTIAKAQGVLDFPRSYFGFTFEQNLNFLPKLFTVNGGGAVVISTATNNTYWMMGVRYEASMLGGLVKGNANITAGWGMNVDAHPEFSNYTSFIDRSYLNNGKVEGIHVATSAGVNFDTGYRGFAHVATGRVYYYNYGAVEMNMGFGRGRYGFRVASGWGAGASLRLFDMNIAGFDVGMDGELKGFYDYNSSYLSFEGSLSARLRAWIGSCDDRCVNKICWGACFNACLVGCEVCPIPVGAKLCLQPGVRARYNSENGFGLSVDF